MQAVKLKIEIPESHQVELDLPQNLPAGPAEVIILSEQSAAASNPASCMGMDTGRGWIADDFNDPLPDDLQALFEGRS